MQFQKVFQDALIALLTGVLGVLVTFLIALAKKGFEWLGAKIANVKDATFRENLKQLNTLLENTVYNVVTSLQQTLGDEIRESIKNGDGKYKREDLLALKDKALDQVVNQITNTDWAMLQEIYDDLTQHVIDLIEVNVYNLKSDTFLLKGGEDE